MQEILEVSCRPVHDGIWTPAELMGALERAATDHADALNIGHDRMVMLLAGEDSIREVIPFPMNKNAQDLMRDAPSAVDPKQLADVHIAIVEDK